jgi:3-hydroxyisobutyrate dehydrogenase
LVNRLNNLVSAAGLIATAEALIIGKRFGLAPSIIIDVLNASTGRNVSTERKFKQFVLSRKFSAGFPLALMVKDLTTSIELAHSTKTLAPFSFLCRELWAIAMSELDQNSDHTVVIQWYERIANTTLVNKGS